MTKQVAVILSGCGHMDGAEIRESVLTLLALSKMGAKVSIFAPDIKQKDVVNHANGASETSARNVFEESARIARGDIAKLEELSHENFDALIIPGGFGVAKNLSNFAEKGAAADVNVDFKRVVKAFASSKKPIGAICIAPAVLAVILGQEYSPLLTIGDDEGVAAEIEKAGAKHQNCKTNDIIYDTQNKIVTCSAYMRNDELKDIAQGIEKLVAKVLEIS